ncbi:MAG: ATP-binding cassette domain-containing protein [Sporomusaceae bacterium]|nr:ATP-binding cassette domain-containing protein [Sporomusaceae bacterium]
MSEIIKVAGVTFAYAAREEPTLKNINLQVAAGEFILLTGASGCGKSTLLKLLNGLIPHEVGGELEGNVYLDGQNSREVLVADLSALVGMVFQSPEDQIFASTVFDEVAFVLENMGLTAEEIAPRVKEALDAVGLGGKEECNVHTLSGGQKQRLAVAAVLAAKPKVLALDEPISQVDPANAEKLLNLLVKLNKEENIAVILVEHRLHEALPLCGRVMVMDAGEIIWDGPAAAALLQPEIFSRYGLRLPQVLDICHRLKIELTNETRQAAQRIRARFALNSSEILRPVPPLLPKPAALSLDNLSFSYDSQKNILQKISLTVGRGEIIALMGTNGAGKSTLLQNIAGILTPDAGKISFSRPLGKGKIGFVMQNPDLMLFSRTVQDEILFGLRQLRPEANEENLVYETLAAQLALNGTAQDFPLSLSRGQRLRVAIAAVLSFEPELLLLDEPTTGQDISRIGDILTALRTFAAGGGTVIFCTHDTEIAASFAARILLMQEGEIIADAPPAAVFNEETLLQQAGLKKPPVMSLTELLNLKTALSVEEAVREIESAAIGNRA